MARTICIFAFSFAPWSGRAEAPASERGRARAVIVAGALLGLLSATQAYGVTLERSLEPPPWASRTSHCVRSLTSPARPSGVVGYIGYNVYTLKIVRRSGETCANAKNLAYSDWLRGSHAHGLRWRYVRAWRSTSGGSAYIGDFVGASAGHMVEYLAIH
jgi:hypothetical protein